jgi:hypothetical protein
MLFDLPQILNFSRGDQTNIEYYLKPKQPQGIKSKKILATTDQIWLKFYN